MRLRDDVGKGRLRLLEALLPQWAKFQRKARLRPLHYVDLLAGPGKIKFSPSGQVRRSSALLALTAQPTFDQFWFAEPYRQERSALELRARTSRLRDVVNVLTGDVAAATEKVVQAVDASEDKASYLVYIDQDKLSYKWETVTALATLPAVSLMLDFSGTRFVPANTTNIMFDKAQQTKLDDFFGDGSWRSAYRPVARGSATAVHNAMLRVYAERIATLQQTQTQRFASGDNSKQKYSILVTSRSPFPARLWDAVMQDLRQPRLF